MESPAFGDQRSCQRLNRKPLLPKNFLADPAAAVLGEKHLKPKPIHISALRLINGDADKENRQVYVAPVTTRIEIGPLEASLAEELVAIRRMKERLRAERERMEKVLWEKDLVLEREMREVKKRGEEQRRVEIEIQRLVRLKDLRSYCTGSSPFQSLRAKEQQKRCREEKPNCRE